MSKRTARSPTKPSYDISELDPADTGPMLEFRNEIFGFITREQWDAMDCTAVVAKRGRRLFGAIPLQYRELRLNRRVSIPVVFENAVGVAEAYRSRGLGTAMLDCAADFIRERVHALCVYRGGERSIGYRFYRKTHHGDVYFTDHLELDTEALTDNGPGESRAVQVLPWTELPRLEARLLPIFNGAHGAFGGHWKRERGFFKRIIASHVHGDESCRLLLANGRDGIQGYAVLNPADLAGCNLYEIAAGDKRALKRLLAKAGELSKQRGKNLGIVLNREHPYYADLLELGFEPKGSQPYIMARVLRPERIFRRLAGKSSLLETLHLKAATPHRDLTLNQPDRPLCTATLYLKESQLSRLLFCRTDLGTALGTGLIRIDPLPRKIEAALCRIFRYSPWVSFRTDYI